MIYITNFRFSIKNSFHIHIIKLVVFDGLFNKNNSSVVDSLVQNIHCKTAHKQPSWND